MKKEEYLADFQLVTNSIIEKYLNTYDESNLSAIDFLNTQKRKFEIELAKSGTKIIHSATVRGVDDLKGLIDGVQIQNFISVNKFLDSIRNKSTVE